MSQPIKSKGLNVPGKFEPRTSLCLEEMSKALTRFWGKVEKTDHCWIWAAHKSRIGYGQFWFSNTNMSAHRFIWIAENGPIPSGLIIDHLCRNRGCVRTEHMELVTAKENTYRGNGPAGINHRVIECPLGHPYEGRNLTFTKQGTRVCMACRRIYNRKRRGTFIDPKSTQRR